MKLDINELNEQDIKELENKILLIEKEIDLNNIKAGTLLVSINDNDPIDHIKRIAIIGQNLLIETCNRTFIKMDIFKLWYYGIDNDTLLLNSR